MKKGCKDVMEMRVSGGRDAGISKLACAETVGTGPEGCSWIGEGATRAWLANRANVGRFADEIGERTTLGKGGRAEEAEDERDGEEGERESEREGVGRTWVDAFLDSEASEAVAATEIL